MIISTKYVLIRLQQLTSNIKFEKSSKLFIYLKTYHIMQLQM